MKDSKFWQDLVTGKSLIISAVLANIITMICSIFITNTIALLFMLQILFVGFLILFSKVFKGLGKIITAIVMLIVLITLTVCNNNNNNKPNETPKDYTSTNQQQDVTQDQPQQDITQDQSQPEEDQNNEEEKQEDNQTINQTTNRTTSKATAKSSYTRKSSSGGASQIQANEILQVSYGAGAGQNSNKSGYVNTTVGYDTTNYEGQVTQPNDPIDTNGKDVTEQNEGVDSVADTATDEEKDAVNGTNRFSK